MTPTGRKDQKSEGRRPASDPNPVLGLVVTDADTDAMARALLRASERGHDVFVAYCGDHDPEAIQFARRFDGAVVYEFDDSDEDHIRETLVKAARAYDYPGMIFHRDPNRVVDFDDSVTAWAEDGGFTVDARVEEADDAAQTCHVLVAVPAYDEAGTIGGVVAQANPHADEVLVVDDGSDDDTAEIARRAGATVIEHGNNKGYGAALQTAFTEAKTRDADHLVILDGDGQHDPGDVPKLVEAQKETRAEIVVGSRFVGDSESDIPAYRRFGLWVINVLTNLSVGIVRRESRIADTQSGFRAYDARAIETLARDDSLGDRMTASTDILYHAIGQNYAIEEVPTTIDYDVENGSSHHPLAHGLGLLNNILKTVERNRPMTVLGVPGFTCAFAGLSASYWTISSYVRTGTFPIGHAAASAFLVLAGVFACFTAIILHAFNHQA